MTTAARNVVMHLFYGPSHNCDVPRRAAGCELGRGRLEFGVVVPLSV